MLDAGNGHAALAAVRSFARAGIAVGLGTPNPRGLVAASRFVARPHPIPYPEHDLHAFAAAVRAAAATGRYDVVFGAGDDFMAALAEVADEVPAAVAHRPREAVLRSLDKQEVAQLGAHAGFRVPVTSAATDAAIDAWTDWPAISSE